MPFIMLQRIPYHKKDEQSPAESFVFFSIGLMPQTSLLHAQYPDLPLYAQQGFHRNISQSTYRYYRLQLRLQYALIRMNGVIEKMIRLSSGYHNKTHCCADILIPVTLYPIDY